MSAIQPSPSEASEASLSTEPKKRYPLLVIGLGLLIGIGLCTVGFQRFAAISRQFSTLPSGIPR